MKKETITDKRGYVYTQNKDSVTIRICGEAYANLRKISEVLTAYGQGWEATPIEVLDYYVMDWAFNQLVPGDDDQSAAGGSSRVMTQDERDERAERDGGDGTCVRAAAKSHGPEFATMVLWLRAMQPCVVLLL